MHCWSQLSTKNHSNIFHFFLLPPEIRRLILRLISVQKDLALFTATCKQLRQHYNSETWALCLLTAFGSQSVLERDEVYNTVDSAGINTMDVLHELIFKRKANIHVKRPNPRDLALVKAFEEVGGADIRAEDDRPLQEAARGCRFTAPVVRYLLRKGADVHAQDDAALRDASWRGSAEVVGILLHAGANVRAENDAALRGASGARHAGVVRILVDAGADVHANNDAALRQVVRERLWRKPVNVKLETVRVLLDAGADVHAKNNTTLLHASLNGFADVVRLLVEAGADVHARNDIALRCTVGSGHLGVVQVLLDGGANVRAEAEASHEAPLHYDLRNLWCSELWNEMMGFLPALDSEGVMHAYDHAALVPASAKGHVEIVRVLLAAGSDVHAKNDAALRLASINGNVEVVRVLLDAGADVHADNDGALGYASAKGHVEVVRILLDAEADVYGRNDAALCYASVYGYGDVVRVLLDAGADVYAENNAALVNAAKRGHVEVVRTLLDAGADAQAVEGLLVDLVESQNRQVEIVNALAQVGLMVDRSG
ncbi:hypothetical protein HK102_001188 [Quaeritorhiza haematococci]|nr:hypothetical protein HK102_001188 [Quaeritorhiza haematococci]